MNPNVNGSLWGKKEKGKKLLSKRILKYKISKIAIKLIINHQEAPKNHNSYQERRNANSLITSLENMWASWFFGPLSAKKEPIMNTHPIVKQIANFWGISTMTGRNIAKAIKTKKIPAARSKEKYIRDFPEGTLVAADWKLPGISLTPFETLKPSIHIL